MSTLYELRQLKYMAMVCKLKAPTSFWEINDNLLLKYYNGTGPAWFPQSLRHIIDEILTLSLPAVLIHDYYYSVNNGTRQDFNIANKDLYNNIRKLIAYHYPMMDVLNIITRVRWEMRAYVMYKACCKFGWGAYIGGKK